MTNILAAGDIPLVVKGEMAVVPIANGFIDLKEEKQLDEDSSKSGICNLSFFFSFFTSLHSQ